MNEHRIITWNVNGLRARGDAVAAVWSELRPTILCLQETKCAEAQVPEAVTALPDVTAFYNAGPPGYSGTAILCRTSAFPTAPTLGPAPFDLEGRATLLELGERSLVNLYMPNGGKGFRQKLEFYDALLDWADAGLDAGRQLWICGDMNVAHTEDDLANPKANVGEHGFTEEERRGFQNFLDAGFVDTFRLFTEGNGHYSWWSYMSKARERNAGWRIDYFLASERLKKAIVGAEIHNDVMGSDHCPVSVELDEKKLART